MWVRVLPRVPNKKNMENIYKELTVEMVEEALLQIQENSKDEPKFVLQCFGTVEQIEKMMKEYDDAITKELKEWINKHKH